MLGAGKLKQRRRPKRTKRTRGPVAALVLADRQQVARRFILDLVLPLGHDGSVHVTGQGVSRLAFGRSGASREGAQTHSGQTISVPPVQPALSSLFFGGPLTIRASD